MEIRITPTMRPRKIMINGSIVLLIVDVLYSTSSIYWSDIFGKEVVKLVSLLADTEYVGPAHALTLLMP